VCQEDTWFHTSRLHRSRNLLFTRERIREVRHAVPKVHETINKLDGKCAEIFHGHPFYEAPDLAPMLRRLLARTHITT
jgi:hypothetical protein